MNMAHYELLIVGGGAAGMAAALAAERAGKTKILLLERNAYLGGILPQCIHKGFGLGYFHEDLTGPEYAERFIQQMNACCAKVLLDTTVLELRADKTALFSSANGLQRVRFDDCILASGAREKPVGALPVSGTRPAGIFTAGQAQKMVNLAHYDIGEDIVILGSGDIGQIMARRCCLLGKTVRAMVEIADHAGGLLRNQKNCIDSFHIPLMLRSTITKIHGTGRISGVSVRNLDSGKETFIPCDTLLTAVGLIPERELIKPLEADGALPDWLHCCGNCDYIHEIVDSVSFQAEKTASELQ